MIDLAVTFPQPAEPVSINALSGKRWPVWRRQLDPWREAAGLEWYRAYGRQALPPCVVEVALGFTTNRRRDPHNYVDTVVKAIVDGLVRAGCWPDDTGEWVSVAEPTLVKGFDCTVRCVERRPDDG